MQLSQKLPQYQSRTLDVLRKVNYGNPSDKVKELVVRRKADHKEAENLREKDLTQMFEVGFYDRQPDFDKMIVNISPSKGCPVGCAHCDIGAFAGHLTKEEMMEQIFLMLNYAKATGTDIDYKPLKINFAKSGDGLLNRKHLIETFNEILYQLGASIKFSTILPGGAPQEKHFEEIAKFAAAARSRAENSSDATKFPSVQLQISTISTDNDARNEFAQTESKTKVMSLEELGGMVKVWRKINPDGRKANLSFLLTEDTPMDATQLKEHVNPKDVRLRFRPCVINSTSSRNSLQEISPARMQTLVKQFKDAGFNVVLDGVPSSTEKEHGLASGVTLERYRDELRRVHNINS